MTRMRSDPRGQNGKHRLGGDAKRLDFTSSRGGNCRRVNFQYVCSGLISRAFAKVARWSKITAFDGQQNAECYPASCGLRGRGSGYADALAVIKIV